MEDDPEPPILGSYSGDSETNGLYHRRHVNFILRSSSSICRQEKQYSTGHLSMVSTYDLHRRKVFILACGFRGFSAWLAGFKEEGAWRRKATHLMVAGKQREQEELGQGQGWRQDIHFPGTPHGLGAQPGPSTTMNTPMEWTGVPMTQSPL